jgi:hypothetical protein
VTSRRRRALAPVFLVPALLLLALLGYATLTQRDDGRRLALAPGTAGGVLHPVAGNFEPDETQIEECGDDVACLQQAFGNVAFQDGPRRALALFESRLASDSVVEQACHRIVHAIGSASLARSGGDIARTFALGSPTCVSGYYHGILERAFLGVTSPGKLAASARSLCVSAGMRRHGFLDYQCRHGLGHGLMIQTGYDLPVTLSICARLGSGWDRRACASGAFMENVDTRFGVVSRWLDEDDPLYPCGTVATFDGRSCYLRAAARLLSFNEGDFAKTAASCGRLRDWARTCFQGLGREATDAAPHDPRKTRELCRRTGSGEADCLFGAARTIANASGARGVEPARALCAGVSDGARSECFSGIGLVLGMLYPTDSAREAACVRIAGRYAGACLEAARAEIDPSGARSWG